MKSIGIDIGAYSIKVAEIESDSQGINLYDFHEFQIPVKAGTDNELAIIDILRNFLAEKDIENLPITVAINQNYVTHRRTFFPFKVRHNIQKALPLEIEDDVPFSTENAIFDAKILSYQVGGGANVLASITPKDRIVEQLQACKDSGFEPHIISCETLAYSNLFENWSDLPALREDFLDATLNVVDEEDEESETPIVRSEAGALIHIGHSKTLLMIYQNNELVTCRTLGWGGKLLAREIHKKYQIPTSEAIKELQSKGFILLSPDGATEAQATFSKILESPLIELGRKLKLALLEIESELHINVSKCSLTGGVSKLKNLGPFLTQQLEIVTNPLNPDIPNFNNKSTNFNAALGGVALGLAIESVKKPRNPATNFLKDDFAQSNQGFTLFKERWGKTIQMGGAVFMLLLLHSCIKSNVSENNYFEAQDNLKALAKKEKSIKRASSRSIKTYIREKKQLKAKVKDLEKINRINSALDVLTNISRSVPSARNLKLDIVRLQVKDEDVQLVGYVDQRDNLQALKKALETIALKKNVRSLNVKIQSKPGKKSFAYSFRTQRLEKGI